jgi:hypothetical protein
MGWRRRSIKAIHFGESKVGGLCYTIQKPGAKIEILEQETPASAACGRKE